MRNCLMPCGVRRGKSELREAGSDAAIHSGITSSSGKPVLLLEDFSTDWLRPTHVLLYLKSADLDVTAVTKRHHSDTQIAVWLNNGYSKPSHGYVLFFSAIAFNHNLLYLPSLPLWFQLSHLVYRFNPRLRTSSVPTFPLGSLAGEGPEAGEEGPSAAAPVPDVLRQPGLCPGGGPSQGASVLRRALGFPKDPP